MPDVVGKGFPVFVRKTLMFRTIRDITIKLDEEKYKYKLPFTIYDIFSFILLIALVTSNMGVYNKNDPELVFSLSVVSSFFVVLTIIVMLAS